jgi:hypothetical protein
MRRRVAIGLAEPLVANRFFLWGTSSLFSCAAIWTASVPYAVIDDLEVALAIAPAVRIVTAIAGIGSCPARCSRSSRRRGTGGRSSRC